MFYEPFGIPGFEALDTLEFRVAAATLATTFLTWLIVLVKRWLLGPSSPEAHLLATKGTARDVAQGDVPAKQPESARSPVLSQEAKDWLLLLEDPCRPWRLGEEADEEIVLEGRLKVWPSCPSVSCYNGPLWLLHVKKGEDWVKVTDLFSFAEREVINRAAWERRQSLKHFKDENDRRVRLGVEKEVLASAFPFRRS